MSAKKQTHCGQVAVTIWARKFDFDSESLILTGSSIVAFKRHTYTRRD
jgi:hypothetical protein